MTMQAVHYPIDTSLNFNQDKKVIRDMKLARLAIPHTEQGNTQSYLIIITHII